MILTLISLVKTRICPQCSEVITYNCYSSWHGAKTRNSICKSCRTTNANKSPKRYNQGQKNWAWKGYKGVGYKWFSKYYERGYMKHDGSITIEDAYNKLEAQGFKCALSGTPLAWSEDSGMSIDRIDSSRGYHMNNIQLVHKDVNLMKNHFNQDYFIEVCRKIVYNMGTT